MPKARKKNTFVIDVDFLSAIIRFQHRLSDFRSVNNFLSEFEDNFEDLIPDDICLSQFIKNELIEKKEKSKLIDKFVEIRDAANSLYRLIDIVIDGMYEVNRRIEEK